ncbi:hypothetical protein MTO96_002539 [Rhipicephalus appendiculatus]
MGRPLPAPFGGRDGRGSREPSVLLAAAIAPPVSLEGEERRCGAGAYVRHHGRSINCNGSAFFPPSPPCPGSRIISLYVEAANEKARFGAAPVYDRADWGKFAALPATPRNTRNGGRAHTLATFHPRVLPRLPACRPGQTVASSRVARPMLGGKQS